MNMTDKAKFEEIVKKYENDKLFGFAFDKALFEIKVNDHQLGYLYKNLDADSGSNKKKHKKKDAEDIIDEDRDLDTEIREDWHHLDDLLVWNINLILNRMNITF